MPWDSSFNDSRQTPLGPAPEFSAMFAGKHLSHSIHNIRTLFTGKQNIQDIGIEHSLFAGKHLSQDIHDIQTTKSTYIILTPKEPTT